MTLDAVYTLEDACDDALEKLPNGRTRELIRWIQLHHRKVLDANQLTMEVHALGSMLRARRKKKSGGLLPAVVANLCLDFGLDVLDLPDEVSVPGDMDNVLYGPCEWTDIDDVTVDDLDKHLILLEAQIGAITSSAANIRALRQAAARIVPGRTDIPLHELRDIAKRQRSGA